MIGVAGGCVGLQDGTPPATPSRRSNINIASLPSSAPDILVKNTIYVRENHSLLALHEVEQRRKFQSLVRRYVCGLLQWRRIPWENDSGSLIRFSLHRYIAQILDGCQEPYCTTSTCLSFRRRVADVPLRNFTVLSARTVACFLASEDDPEKALCLHEPTMPSGLHALTNTGTHLPHRKHEARSIIRKKARPDKETLEGGLIISTVKAQRAAKDGDAAAKTTDPCENSVCDRPRLGGTPSYKSRSGDKTTEATVEKGREKDPKSFTQNLFDTFAVRMLEWLPVPNLTSLPDFTLAAGANGDSSKTQKADENQISVRNLEHSDRVESRKLGDADAGDSKLKPRAHSVTTRLRLNPTSTPIYTKSPATRKASKPKVLNASEELKQESQQYPQTEMLRQRQRQGLREQGAQATTQSEILNQAERKDNGLVFCASILNEECTTAPRSPDSAKAWGQLKTCVTQNQEDTSISCTDKLGSRERSHECSDVGCSQVDTVISLSGSPSVQNSDPDPTLVFDIPVEQTLASEAVSVQIHPRNGYARCDPTHPVTSTNNVPAIDVLGESRSSGSSAVSMPPLTPLKYRTDSYKISTLTPEIDHSSSGRPAISIKKRTGPGTGRLPQCLSHLSVDIVEGLLDTIKAKATMAEDPLPFYRISAFPVGQASKTSILRQHHRALQFGAQSIFYVMSTPEALLQSFRTGSDDDTRPSGEKKLIKSDHPSHIDHAIRRLKAFDESKVIFRSLWITLGPLFTPTPDLSHPKSPRLKAAISLSKTRSSSSSGEHVAVPSSTNNVYYPDREAIHIIKLSLSALVAAVPHANVQTMLAVRTLRASGRVAPDASLLTAKADLVRSLLEVTDALEDELALSLMSRLVRAIAARCCAAEIIRNKQTRNYSRGSQETGPLDILSLLRDYLREAHSEKPYSGAAKSLIAGHIGPNTTSGSSNGWWMSAVTVEWLRSVLLKEWDGRAEVARWGVVGGAVMILTSLCEFYIHYTRHLSTLLT